jgi:hypothetical protein
MKINFLRSRCRKSKDIAAKLEVPEAMVKRVALGDGWSTWYRDKRGGVVCERPADYNDDWVDDFEKADL